MTTPQKLDSAPKTGTIGTKGAKTARLGPGRPRQAQKKPVLVWVYAQQPLDASAVRGDGTPPLAPHQTPVIPNS